MSHPFLGCIADDYTGATDVASMLARAGLRVVQCFGIPSDQQIPDDCDAVVVALKSRSMAHQDAIALSLNALTFLQAMGIERFFFKYCSTFDSTNEGNIGPVADSLAAALGTNQVLFCPAFPENGRTVYCGHLFVHGVPLHESSMRNHPLTPMTDSNLLRVLQAQSKRHVVRLPLQATFQSIDDETHYMVDAITNEDLAHVAQIAKQHRLLTGASAIAAYWGKAIAREMLNQMPSRFESPSEDRQRTQPPIVFAGSCSDATRAQVAEFEKSYPVLHLDLSSFADVIEMVAAGLTWCDELWNTSIPDRPPLLISTSVKQELVKAARSKWGDRVAAERAEQVFAGLAKGLLQRGATRFIVAGGETAGAVIDSLGIQSVRIGREIAPGVPWITSIAPMQLTLSLKSGNFGGPTFFLDALEMLA